MDQESELKYLVGKVGNGDRQAMNDLVRKYYPKVFHYIWRLTGRRTLAEDIAQNTFIVVFAKIHQLREAGKLTSWIYRIAHNEAQYEIKKLNRSATVQLFNASQVQGSEKDKQEQLEINERQKLIKRALAQIPREQLEVIILKQYEDLTFREIAEILSLSENTVKSRMYYGLKALKKILQQHPIIKDLYHEAS